MKSDASDLLKLAQAIYIDACAQCPAEVSSPRDLLTIRSRVEHEGISFLTITLPEFCKGFERALEIGYIDPTWRSTFFRRFKFHGGGPVFLSGFLGHVFDYETGRLRDEQDSTYSCRIPRVIESVRQICLAFKKIRLECSESKNAAAVQNFIQVEQDFGSFQLLPQDLQYFTEVSDLVWGHMLYRNADSAIALRHGPGATAEGISGNRKYRWSYWYDRLDRFFPYYDSCYVTSARDSGVVEGVRLLSRNEELPVRVVFVPKTLTSPRVIAIEPVAMQYAQQGIRSFLYEAIESYWLTRGHVNFRDQSINQSLAITSSSTGLLATIDLSDASDRVPHALALRMFRWNPDLLGAIEACRSRAAVLPNGEIILNLRKFASMGSALCFPVEAMYFYTICVMAMLDLLELPVSSRNIYLVTRDIYVYGDDIIVPAFAAEFVLARLQKYNCKPNAGKTFVTGKFRESCGVDAYDGVQVSPVYIRRMVPKTKRDASDLVSWSATANLLFKKGYVRSAEFMHNKCESILGIYPTVSGDSSAVGRVYSIGRKAKMRFNPHLQVREIRAWVVSPVYQIDPLDSYAALSKSLLTLGVKPEPKWSLDALSKGEYNFPSDIRHLERTAMHGACTLKLRWVAAP